MASDGAFLSVNGIHKRFGGVHALRGADLAVAGDDDIRLEPLELAQDLDPAMAVDVDVVRWEPREDREAALLDEVAGKQHALLGEEDRLVAERMCLPPRS